jgi:hypothetical protein
MDWRSKGNPTANFKGPIAYYIPETWSKIGKLFNCPFLYGRGLDARPGVVGGGVMEINTVPRFDAQDAQGTVYSKLPKHQFPVDAGGRVCLVQDVTCYSKAALYDAFKAWRNGGPACSGQVDKKGAWRPRLNTTTPRYDQEKGNKIVGVESAWEGGANHGWLCVKGRFGYDYVGHPDRLTKPKVRKYLVDGAPRGKDRGEWVEVEWDVALDITARKLREARDTHGGDSVGLLTSAKCTNEENYLMNKFARQVIGTNNIDHCARL